MGQEADWAENTIKHPCAQTPGSGCMVRNNVCPGSRSPTSLLGRREGPEWLQSMELAKLSRNKGTGHLIQTSGHVGIQHNNLFAETDHLSRKVCRKIVL